MRTRRLLFFTLIIAGLAGLTIVWMRNRPAGDKESSADVSPAGSPSVPPGERADVSPPVKPGPGNALTASPNNTVQTAPPLIDEICGPQAAVRLRALAKDEALSRADCETLYAFLRQKTTDEKLARMASIKNRVMNLLARQAHPPQPWDRVLQSIVEDETQHAVIRDYALQHLFEFYEATLRESPVARLDTSRRTELRALFWSALERKSESLAGTALVGLFHLSAAEPAIDRPRVLGRALGLLEAANTGDLARITAFQVCAQAAESRALTPAISAAEAASTLPLRVAAIAVVGATGGAAELPLLKRLQNEPNPSLRAAVAAAMHQIHSRTQG